MADPFSLTRADMHRLFELLEGELATAGIEGEVYVVGGAVMCLAFNSSVAQALDVVARYLDENQLPPKNAIRLDHPV